MDKNGERSIDETVGGLKMGKATLDQGGAFYVFDQAKKVDVRSIVAYIENPYEVNFKATPVRKPAETAQVSREAILNAARRGHWNNRTTGK